MSADLLARVEALEQKYKTQRLATLEWGKDVDKLMRWIDDHLKRIMALEVAHQQPADHVPGVTKMVPTPEAAPVATDAEIREYAGERFPKCLRNAYNFGRQHGAAQLLSLEKELERERLRLAACGVVAMADTPESAAKARDICPDFWSASLDDVIRQVDALMEARAAQPAPPVAPAGGLVERVEAAMERDYVITDIEGTWDAQARAAIREVAAWLKSESEGHLGSGLHWSKRLEQEADR